jgi:hypothetical protein
MSLVLLLLPLLPTVLATLRSPASVPTPADRPTTDNYNEITTGDLDVSQVQNNINRDGHINAENIMNADHSTTIAVGKAAMLDESK